MYLTSIEFLKNFRNFSAGYTLSLSAPITILVGDNGSGKSTLLNAVKVCLGDGSPTKFFRLSTERQLISQVQCWNGDELYLSKDQNPYDSSPVKTFHGQLDNLKGAGVLVPNQLNMQLKAGRVSSGQAALLQLADLALNEDCLLLLDEPEVSLSEPRRDELAHRLISWVEKVPRAQCLIATHSDSFVRMASEFENLVALYNCEEQRYLNYREHRALVEDEITRLLNELS